MPENPKRIELYGHDGRQWGYFEYGPNGWIIVSLVEDPPEGRYGAKLGGSLGKVAFSHVRPDDVHVELVNFQGKIDERVRAAFFASVAAGHPDYTLLAGEVTLHLRCQQQPGENEDKASVPILELRHDQITAFVPIVQKITLPGPPPGQVSPTQLLPGQEWYSPDRKMMFALQTDGNLVLYGPGGTVQWASDTVGVNARELVMQADGNLVLYTKSGLPVFNSGTAGYDGATVEVTNNGAVQVIHHGNSIWSRP